MPYSVPPPPLPFIHQISQNSSPTVSPPTAPDGLVPVTAADLSVARADARSLGGEVAVELPVPQIAERVEPSETQSFAPASSFAQAESPDSTPDLTAAPASVRPVPELDALIAVTRARSIAPQTEAVPGVEDFARSGQIAPEVPSTESSALPATPATPPTETTTPDRPDAGQVLTIPGQGETAPPTNETGAAPGQPATPPANPAAQTPPEVIELSADRQEFDEQRQVFRAEGNVVLRFRQAVLTGDRVQVSIPNRLAVADGNAALRRGQQTIRGEQFSYNFGFDQGSVLQARGDVALSASSDFDVNQPTTGSPLGSLQSVGDQVSAAQPIQATATGGGLVFGVGTGGQAAPAQQGAGLSRLRFEAEQLQFNGQNWEATNVRITNDPFSPPELELRSNRVTFTPLSPTATEIRARNPRAVFDQGFTLPLLIDRAVISQERRNPGLFNIGYDERDRGGFFIERTFNVFSNPIVDFSLTPQILVQRALTEDGFLSGSSYGLIARLTANPTPTTSIVGNAVFTSLDLGDLEDTFRASLRAQQRIFANHTLALEYSYRDRLFNGSLGFQNVQSSLGFVITSPPNLTLGQTGINVQYQGGVQFINARSDRNELVIEQNGELSPDAEENRVDLTRYQVGATLSRPVLLWAGTPLPPTPTEGLRYTPTPIVPYVALVPSVRGVYSGYSNGETQASLTGSITLAGQFGNFSRPFLDYTAFNVTYSRTALSGESPFLFDRVADEQVISAGITQQIYGPIRFGVQASYNLDRGNDIDTVYTLEYSRRTYSLTAAYSPRRQAASIVFRLFDFNWSGDPGPFSGLNPEDNVINGVRQRDLQR